MAWKMEVTTGDDWASNACVFATKEEADAAGHEKNDGSGLVTRCRVSCGVCKRGRTAGDEAYGVRA